jgi:hypothetical protein
LRKAGAALYEVDTLTGKRLSFLMLAAVCGLAAGAFLGHLYLTTWPGWLATVLGTGLLFAIALPAWLKRWRVITVPTAVASAGLFVAGGITRLAIAFPKDPETIALVTALATGFLAVSSAGGTLLAWWSTREERRTALIELAAENANARQAVGIDSLWRITEIWDHPKMHERRERGALALLYAHRTATDLAATLDLAGVLNVFERLGFLVYGPAVISVHDAWDTFSGWAIAYWEMSQAWVHQSQVGDPGQASNYERLVSDFISLEPARTPDELRAFALSVLRAEAHYKDQAQPVHALKRWLRARLE